jgi:hypothetical protein
MTERIGLLGVTALLSALLAVSGVAPQTADVTGHWRVTITASVGTVSGVAAFKRTGQAVSGWVGPSEDDPIPVTGVLKGNKLTIETHPQPGRTAAFARCDVTLNGDKMTGTIDTNQGTIEFVRTASAASRP